MQYAGTPIYMSPEMATIMKSLGPLGYNPDIKALSIKISMSSDIWSLGVVIYIILYHKAPYGPYQVDNTNFKKISNGYPIYLDNVATYKDINDILRHILVPEKDRYNIKQITNLMKLSTTFAIFNRRKWFFGLF